MQRSVGVPPSEHWGAYTVFVKVNVISVVVLLLCDGRLLNSLICVFLQNMSAFESELENLLGEFHIKMKGEIGRQEHDQNLTARDFTNGCSHSQFCFIHRS